MNDKDLIEHIKNTLTIEDAKHIKHIRAINYGKISVEIRHGRPVRGLESIRDTKYTD